MSNPTKLPKSETSARLFGVLHRRSGVPNPKDYRETFRSAQPREQRTLTPVNGVPPWMSPDLNPTRVLVRVRGPHVRNASQWCDPMHGLSNDLNQTLVFYSVYGDPTTVTPVSGVTPWIVE